MPKSFCMCTHAACWYKLLLLVLLENWRMPTAVAR